MNTDERRAKKIVRETGEIENLDALFQEFVLSDYRKSLGNRKPHALAVAFRMWLKEEEK